MVIIIMHSGVGEVLHEKRLCSSVVVRYGSIIKWRIVVFYVYCNVRLVVSVLTTGDPSRGMWATI